MTTLPRQLISDFALENLAYVGASVTFYEVDPVTYETTETVADLYAGPTGPTLLTNPQVLDSRGKFQQPVYIDRPVTARIVRLGPSGEEIEEDTGIIGWLFLLSFLDLVDTPDSYTGHGGKLLAVKASQDGVEFVRPGVRTVDQVERTGNFTLAAADKDVLLANSGSDITGTVPTNASVPWAIGRSVSIHRVGAGRLIIAAAVGVTVRTPTGANPEARDQNSTVTLLKIGTDVWLLTGDLDPA